ncbi:MAG: UvrD-helicase domain-containing protein [Chloroflexi bacterium]|nr:UvrD-helicase domain-containing protein [Chloroflexota bacterium]
MTCRIAYLIAEKGVSPAQILAITFTNKAAAEMAQRLTGLLGPTVANQLIIKTFHAFGAMILRESGERLGLSQVFAIATDPDRQALLKSLYPDFSDKEITQYLEQISAAKNQLLTPEALEGSGATHLESALHLNPQFIEVYHAYEAALQKNQLLDFDGLILRPVHLFEAYPDVLEMYQQRFRWISVDEYQDINLAQYRLLRLLTPPATNICAIGDPDQAIYGFRGASQAYFLKFQEDFPAAKIVHLSQNYRSTQLILDASGQVIAKSARERIKIWSEFLDKTKLDIYQAPTAKAEAEYVVHQIEQMVGGTSYFSLDTGRVTDDDHVARSFADFAVLYRLGAQNQLLVEAVQRSGMPYQTVGQTPLYEYKEIRELLAYLWLLYNPAATFPLETALPKKQLAQSRLFVNDLRQASATSVAALIEQIHQFIMNFRSFDEKHTERIQQLILKAAPFENRLSDFLESTVLQKETDAYDPRADRVTLMTLHAAKGLEFPVVFMVGCEENLLPYQMQGRISDLEEERRLFYVGMTRAQHKLILTHAKTRFLFGQRYQPEPSRFLSDIENALKELKQMAPRKPVKEKPEPAQLKLF